MSKKIIPKEFYKEIMKNIPIVCIDLVVVNGKKFLLGKRKNEPVKNEWFVPGGRVLKDEKLINAVIRKTKEEVGIDINESDIDFLTVGETIFKEGEDRHSINIVYKINTTENNILNFDTSQTSEVKWFEKVENNWHPFVKQVLVEAGFSFSNSSS